MARTVNKGGRKNLSTSRMAAYARESGRTRALSVRAGDAATAHTPEPLSAPGRQPTARQSLASRTAFFRVPREGTPYFLGFTAKLSPGLAANGATSYVPATIAGRTSDRLKRSVKDGDTIGIAFDGSQSIRFLGIDTPEKSFKAPFRLDRNGDPVFVDIGLHAAAWDAYLKDAITPGGQHNVPLGQPLRQRLARRIKPGVAANHALLAAAASKALFDHVSKDVTDLANGQLDAFGIFGAMAHEPFDGYGRILAFLRPEQRDVPPAQRRIEYNTRQLAVGAALPYFIWPNVEPFRKATLISEAVFPPPVLRQRARASRSLKQARDAVRAARQARAPNTVFDPQRPLQLAAFELRFLADRRAPSRVVVDLAAADNEPILWPAEAYFVVPNPEDRLYVPVEYLALFKQNGWRDPTAPELAAKIAAAPDVGPTGLPL
jgi:hypothetical protein